MSKMLQCNILDMFSTLGCYFTAATLGAHSNAAGKGFRQKDLRFILGLFLNWMDGTQKGAEASLHNTQIARYLEVLVKHGFAKRSGVAKASRYSLTRSGLLELVTRLTRVPVHAPMEQFFFVNYFVNTYRQRLTELVEREGSFMPASLRLELESLLDSKELIQTQIRFVELEIRKLAESLRDTQGAMELAERESRKGVSAEVIIGKVEKEFPYELNSHKPLSEFLHDFPPDLRLWD